MKIKKLSETAQIPSKGSERAAGYDLYAIETHTLQPGERKVFKTGISIAIPEGLYGRIAPRSGLAVKNGIDVLAGVVDSDYRGEIMVVLNVVLVDSEAPIPFKNLHKVKHLRI